MMKKSIKWTLSTLALTAVGCGFAAAAIISKPVSASAEDSGTVAHYINVGASEALAESEYVFENKELVVDSSSAGTLGTDESGKGVFASYRTGASLSLTVEAGDYRVTALTEAGATLTLGGTEVTAEGKVAVADVTTTGTIAVTSESKLYAVMISSSNSKILMHAEWNEGQVVVYGKLLEEELTRGCPAYYSDGTVENAVEYSSIPAGVGDGSTGLNANFNAVSVTGTFKATGAAVERHLISMPEKLVYFANLGSVNGHAGPFGDETDPYYSYNQTVFDYYRSVGSTLLNDGNPYATTSSDAQFGVSTNGWNANEKSLNFPFNSGRVTRESDFGTSNLEYHLPNVEAGDYVLYIGTVSYWHGRTLGVFVNGTSMGNISVPAARVIHTFNISRSAKGTVTVKLTGADTNEALASFIAIQKREDAPQEAPGAITAEADTVGLEDTSVEIMGVQEGARVQIFSAARPYQLIYEEIATAGNFKTEGENVVYTLNFKKPVTDMTKISIVQLTDGGYGAAHEMAVTDIQNFVLTYDVNGKKALAEPEYTTGDIVLHISAEASSGLNYYKVRKNYDAYEVHDLGSEREMSISYTVTENATYEFVIYSLLGVSYTNRVEITYIDRTAPVISLAPTEKGWDGTKYTISVSVKSVTPVESYRVTKGGVEKKSETATAATPLETFELELTEAGEYAISVTNKAQQTAVSTVVVGSNAPVYTKVKKKPVSTDEAQITFDCIENYSLSSLAVYRIGSSSVDKLSVIGGDEVSVYYSGTYVAVVKTNTGATEVFGFEVETSDFKKASTKKTESSKQSYTGTIVTACLFGAAAIGLGVVFILIKKKKI